MKVIITGTVNFSDSKLLESVIKESKYKITDIICGDLQGADVLAQQYAKKKKITPTVIVPDWKKYNRNARDIANAEMVESADAVFLFWDGIDAGCKVIYRQATAKRIPIISKVIVSE